MKKNTIVSEIEVSYKPSLKERAKVTTSQSAYTILLSSWSMQTIHLQEEFKILLLNRANEALGIYHMAKGGVSGTVVDIKLVFAVALKCNATGIIIAHNHPSGNLTPSEPDKKITSQIKQGSELLGTTLLDHLIITGENGYYSFSDNGMLR